MELIKGNKHKDMKITNTNTTPNLVAFLITIAGGVGFIYQLGRLCKPENEAFGLDVCIFVFFYQCSLRGSKRCLLVQLVNFQTSKEIFHPNPPSQLIKVMKKGNVVYLDGVVKCTIEHTNGILYVVTNGEQTLSVFASRIKTENT